jgi:hypothetical protein
MKTATTKTVPEKKAGGRDKQGPVRKKKAAVAKKKAQPRKRKPGPETKLTPQVEAIILELTANTTDSLKRICDKNKGVLPAPGTIRRWIAENELFRDKYTRAKEEQADVMAEEISDIADELARKKDLTHEQIGAAKLRMEARKWSASKLKPKKYGDRTDITTGGESLNNPFLEFLKLNSVKNKDENS